MTENGRLHFLIVLILVILALIVGAFAGWRARGALTAPAPAADPRRFVPLPTDVAVVTFPPGSLATSPPMDELPTISPLVAAATEVPTPRPEGEHRRTRRASGAIRLRGVATWYRASRRGLVGAAGPVLRHALGKDWRGQRVLVSRGARAVEVKLVDWCACGKRGGEPTLIDLDVAAFGYLAPLSRGVITVTIEGFR